MKLFLFAGLILDEEFLKQRVRFIRDLADKADPLATFDQDSTEQEWLVDLHEHQTVFEKYRHAVGCYLAAPKMRRCAVQALFKEAPGLVWKLSPKAGRNVWQAR